MRTSILVHIARSLVAAAIAVVIGMFAPVFAHGPMLGGTQILDIAQRIIDYLPSSNMYRIGLGAYVFVLCFFGYRAARHLTMLGTIIWAALLGVYAATIALPNLQILPLDAWAHAQAAKFAPISPDIDLAITILVAIVALIVVPVTTAFLLAQIPFLRSRPDESESGPARIEPEI